MFQTKVVQKIETHSMFIDFSFSFESRAVYEIIWGKYRRGRQATDDNTIWRMRFVCRIT